MPQIALKRGGGRLKGADRRLKGEVRHLGEAELVAEVAGAGEHHRDAVLVAGVDGLLVAHRAAGLDDGGHAMGRQRVHVIAEREEGVGGAA